MSYDSKIAAVRSLLEQHNSQVSDESQKIEIDDFFDCLKSQGGTTEDALRASTWEDIENCKIPRILARQIASIFRSKDEKEESQGYVKPSKAKAMSNRQLIEAYNPTEPDNPVAKELVRRAKGNQFLVIIDGKVKVSESEDLLAELKLGHEPRETYFVDGVPRPVYKVGERPDNLVDVNPLFPNEVLRPHGDCVNINKSWQSIPMETRQLIFLARENGELRINDLRDAVGIHADAIMDNGFTRIAAYAPKAHQEFIELKERNELPSLKRRLGEMSDSTPNDPFHGSGHKRY